MKKGSAKSSKDRNLIRRSQIIDRRSLTTVPVRITSSRQSDQSNPIQSNPIRSDPIRSDPIRSDEAEFVRCEPPHRRSPGYHFLWRQQPALPDLLGVNRCGCSTD
jgi:hypothetical protein